MLNNSEEQWYWLVWFSNTALANHGPQTKSDWPPVLPNKVLLGNSHTAIHLYIICGCFGATGRVSSWDRGFTAAKPNIFNSSSFRKKNLTAAALIPCYTEWGSRTDTITLAYLKCRESEVLLQNWIRIYIVTRSPSGILWHWSLGNTAMGCFMMIIPIYTDVNFTYYLPISNSKQWLSTLVKSRITNGACKKYKVRDLPQWFWFSIPEM